MVSEQREDEIEYRKSGIPKAVHLGLIPGYLEIRGKNSSGSPKMWFHPTYHSWHSMLSRKYKKTKHNHDVYKDLYLDPRWWCFHAFLEDMGERPEGTTLDRIDGTKGYYKDNCRWATHEQQARNRRVFGKIDYRGVSLHKRKNTYIANIQPGTGQKLAHIGTFKTAKEAAEARDVVCYSWFGELELLNFPDDIEANTKKYQGIV